VGSHADKLGKARELKFLRKLEGGGWRVPSWGQQELKEGGRVERSRESSGKKPSRPVLPWGRGEGRIGGGGGGLSGQGWGGRGLIK